MKSNQPVIGTTAVYLDGKGKQRVWRRARVLEVHRYRVHEADIGPCMLADVVIQNDADLKRLGGLRPTDRLALGFLDAAGEWANRVKHLVPARDVELVTTTATHAAGELPANSNEIAESIASRCLCVDTLETRSCDRLDFHKVSLIGIRNSLVAAYLEGAKKANRAAKEQR